MSKLEIGTKVKITGHRSHQIEDGAECVVSEPLSVIKALSAGLDATNVTGKYTEEMIKFLRANGVAETEGSQLIPNEYIEVI